MVPTTIHRVQRVLKSRRSAVSVAADVVGAVQVDQDPRVDVVDPGHVVPVVLAAEAGASVELPEDNGLGFTLAGSIPTFEALRSLVVW